jgi:hypothetical protein
VLAETAGEEAEPNLHLAVLAENIRALESMNPFQVIEGGKEG